MTVCMESRSRDDAEAAEREAWLWEALPAPLAAMLEVHLGNAVGAGDARRAIEAGTTAVEQDHEIVLARLARERTERIRMADALHEVAARITEDRREPDKILCHAQTARRAAFSS